MTGPDAPGYKRTGICPAPFPVAGKNGRHKASAAVTNMSDPADPPPIELPITGELDLHGFRPSELGELVPHYLRLCRERGLLKIRVVHGKGTGQIRASVHAILGRMPEVASFSLATPIFGGHGATIVRLRSLEAPRAHAPQGGQATALPPAEAGPSIAN